jgi:hypothetical protein
MLYLMLVQATIKMEEIQFEILPTALLKDYCRQVAGDISIKVE